MVSHWLTKPPAFLPSFFEFSKLFFKAKNSSNSMAKVVLTLIALKIFTLLFLLIIIKTVYETISTYWLIPRRIKKAMEKQGVSGPKPRPLIGNISDIALLLYKSTSKPMNTIDHDIVPRLLPHYLAWSKQYGKRFVYWNGSEPRMCITEIELIKQLLGKNSAVSGKSWLQQQGSKHFIGRGLLMANGEEWYHQRHILAPAFTRDKLKGSGEFMVECTMKMIETLDNQIKQGQIEFEIGDYMRRLTADIISQTEFDNSSDKGKKIFHLLNQLQNLCAQASRHLYLPGSRFFPSKYNREIKSLKKEVERLLMEIIQSRKDSVKIGRSPCYGKDLLGMLLNETHKNGFRLNLQLIMDECKTFFFAGHETTALLLTWTIMLLATNPSWQEKVRAEIKQVFDGENPAIDHLSKLNLLSMVINESLRLYPPATVLPRMALEDMKLGDLYIPKGLSIWIPVLAIHHSEELWGEDVNKFNPQRFASKSSSPGRFIPFAAGPRNCIGQAFAIMEVKIILSMLISRFSFTISNNYTHAPIVILTIKPEYGVQVHLKPINR